ncbi:inner membrane transporter yfaV [Colletotrichum higginsianum]|uniref:Inner membrane transporter yfaV n=2 Tax=Colletotrichum higginsianum TaxID=80884 RepID=H1VV27_COLHI|nr:putative transporter [Colletotrichum higginsianum]CCF44086.1 inner membrane transporter yfaV [Colletotrichum higginsianum]
MTEPKQEDVRFFDSPGQQTPVSEPDWTEREETRARRKIDSSVLPLLYLGLLVFQLDRMNLASALTGGFAADIGVNQDTINLGNQLMFLGIVILEIPSNMLLQKVGPRKYISGQVMLFGFVATMQVFLVDRKGFLAARMMLGLAEAGYIPGACYTLSTWYTKKELAKRIAVFFFGMFSGNALSPILASGILKLEGERGLRGWQWLFLIEGVFTFFVGLSLLFLLPGSPDTPDPLLSPGIVRFRGPERNILQRRLELDDKERRGGAQGMHIPPSLVWKTILHWQRWPHFLSSFAVFSTWSPLTTYTPTIIMNLGFNRIQANALAAVGASLSLVVVFFFAYVSDKTNRRGFSVIGAHACYLVVLVVARTAHPHVGKWSRWGLWTAVNSFAVGYHPAHNSWVQLNCREPGERSISIAMWVMLSISGLMVGTQYYRGNDTPFYQTGLRTQIIMVSVGMAFAILQVVIYTVHNKRVASGKHKPRNGEVPRIYVP